jgi:hypothetical protein
LVNIIAETWLWQKLGEQVEVTKRLRREDICGKQQAMIANFYSALLIRNKLFLVIGSGRRKGFDGVCNATSVLVRGRHSIA